MWIVRLILANGAQYVETVEAKTARDAAIQLAQSKGFGKNDIYRTWVNNVER